VNENQPTPAYHAGMRELQDRFDTRALADRLDERLGRRAFTADDRAFIESRCLFFLATADTGGQPDCSYKGGDPGFVRVTADDELAFPSYDGNGMFRSLGNVQVNPAVALLFIDFERLSIRTPADVEAVRREVESHVAPLGKKVYAVVNYDHFHLDPHVEDDWAQMVHDLVERFYLNVTRYTTSGFLRAKLGPALAARGVAPHIYETAEEARAHVRD